MLHDERMPFVALFIRLLFQLLLFSQNAELQPAFTSQPSNPSTVVEGQNVTLQWSYNLDNQSIAFARIIRVTGSSASVTVSNRIGNAEAVVAAGYENQFRATILDTQATLTILAVRRSIPKEKYQLILLSDSANLQSIDVEISVLFPPVITNISSNQNVIESNNLTLYCEASGNPNPSIIWTNLSDNSTVIKFPRTISREDTGCFRCTADNGIGIPVTKDVCVTVHYKPDAVELVTNTTQDSYCSDVWVNFTCKASDANPAISSYLLYERYEVVAVSNSGIWIQKLSEGSKDVYHCMAEHVVGNVTSTNNVTLTVNGFAAVVTVNTTIFTEGQNVILLCDVIGVPSPSVSWYNDINEKVDDGPLWKLPNIRRNDNGTYKCTANNTCRMDSKTFDIIVLYKPGDVRLTSDISNSTICAEYIVTFTCFGDANPEMDNYTLYENGSAVNTSSLGVWTRTIKTVGQVAFRCEASNSVGFGKSSDVTYNVEVPASVTSVNATKVTEGQNVIIVCDAVGVPPPVVSWFNDKDEKVNNGAIWRLPNISRNDQGTYKCRANNTCNVDYKSTDIIVEFPTEEVSHSKIIGIRDGNSVTLSCPVDGRPKPNVTWYKGIKTTGQVKYRERDWTFQAKFSDGGWYSCSAVNYLNPLAVNVSIQLIVFELSVTQVLPTFTASPTATIGTHIHKLSLTVKNKTLEEFGQEKFQSEVKQQLIPFGVVEVKIEAMRRGSVIVDLVLRFNQSVSVSNVISTLKSAAQERKFGSFVVDKDSIKESAPTSATSSLPIHTGPAQECSCSCNDILAATTGVLVFVIVLLIFVIVWQHRKGLAGQKRPYMVPRDDAEVYDNEVATDDVKPSHSRPIKPEYLELKEVPAFRNEPTEEVRQSALQVQRHRTDYAPLHPSTRSWEIARNSVTIEKIIGKGAFGQVAKGTATDLRGRPGKTSVAVKMLKAFAPQSDRKDLLSELEVMKTLKPHPHVIRLLGCVTESEPLLVLIEYVPYGDLLGYLRKSRGLNDTYYKDPDIKPQTRLTSQQLMKFAWQIADGMRYLSSRSIIHRDLAARNVLVGEKETCKVTDFGMARDVQQENIYERKTRGRLPVKWTACEALLFNTYTTKSDVWSYGIVLYEIFTVGGSPYPRMDGKKIASLLQQGYRMPKPKHVDEKLYEIMMNCWKNEPEARPTFVTLTKQLKDMENQHQKLINMHIYDNQLYAKVEDLNV